MSHPEHRVHTETASGYWEPAIPLEATGWTGWQVRRRCRKAGGHWWHPTDPMIGWGCCNCGARRDGFPKDGT